MSNISKTTLGELIEFQRGYDLPKSEMVDGIYPVRSSNGILGYHNEFKTKGPGITIGRSGTVGIPHLIKTDFYPHNTALFVKDFKGNDVVYIFYLLANLKLNDRKTGSGVPTMNRNHLHPLNILAYLDVSTQKQTAKVLSDIDAKIEVNNKINQELEAMAKTLYDYWFVQFDFPDANGKPYKSSGGKMVFNEELKREIPKGWEDVELSKLESNIVTGKTPSTKIEENFNGDVPFICIGDVRGNMHITTTELTLSELGANSQSNKYIPEGAICVTCIASPGLVGFTTKDSQTNQQLNTIVCKKFENRYFLYFYLLNYFKFAKAKTGNTFANMNKGDFSSIKIIKPNEKVLKLFSDKLKASIEKILINSKQNEKLSELRDWLLPMLMNGQVRVGEKVELEESEVKLGLAAEPPTPYGNESLLSDLFPLQDLYAEVACMLALEQQINKNKRGKTWVQKTASHAKDIKKAEKLKNVAFEEYYWGMYSTTIAKAIEQNPYLIKDNVGSAIVYKLRSNKISEINQWMQQPKNAAFVKSIKEIITLYNDPLINNDLERIELLNTVHRCMHKLGTSDFDLVYQAMREWPMQEQGYSNKAEKFKEMETMLMIGLVKKLV